MCNLRFLIFRDKIFLSPLHAEIFLKGLSAVQQIIGKILSAVELRSTYHCIGDMVRKMCIESIQLDREKFIRAEYAFPQKAGETFGEILSRFLSELRLIGVTQREICEATRIESSLISKYKNGRRKPTLYAVILLSLAMKLTPERSAYLLQSAGFALNDSTEHRIYKLFLQGCAFSDDFPIENCNDFLLAHGFSMLCAETVF